MRSEGLVGVGWYDEHNKVLQNMTKVIIYSVLSFNSTCKLNVFHDSVDMMKNA